MNAITHSSMVNIDGRPVTIRAARGYHGYGTHPFSITRRTVRRVRLFEAEWLPTSNRDRFATKREAVKFIQAHEAIAYDIEETS